MLRSVRSLMELVFQTRLSPQAVQRDPPPVSTRFLWPWELLKQKKRQASGRVAPALTGEKPGDGAALPMSSALPSRTARGVILPSRAEWIQAKKVASRGLFWSGWIG